MVDRKFELSVDQWRFVGHPFSVYNGTFSITFNVVFVLEVSYTIVHASMSRSLILVSDTVTLL